MTMDVEGWSYGTYFGNHLKGWFIPPATTRYRFYQSCDDNCRFYMGLNTTNPTDLTQLINAWHWSYPRDYFNTNNDNQTSGWYNLTKGQPYYIEARHREGGGWDHMSVAVEVEQNATDHAIIDGHHQHMSEIQYVQIQPE